MSSTRPTQDEPFHRLKNVLGRQRRLRRVNVVATLVLMGSVIWLVAMAM